MTFSFNELVWFVVSKEIQYKGKEKEVEEVLRQHAKYKTLDFDFDDKGITYVLRYNITEDGKTADVLDLAIREDKKSFRFLKEIISKNWKRWGGLEFFRFERTKYDRKHRVYSLRKVMKDGFKDTSCSANCSTCTKHRRCD